MQSALTLKVSNESLRLGHNLILVTLMMADSSNLGKG